jgi:hypothetical protein
VWHNYVTGLSVNITKENTMSIPKALDFNKQILGGFESVILALSDLQKGGEVKDTEHAARIAELQTAINALTQKVDAGQELDAVAIQAAKDAAIAAVTGFETGVAPKLAWLADELKKSGGDLSALISNLDTFKGEYARELAALRADLTSLGNAQAVTADVANAAKAAAVSAHARIDEFDAYVQVAGGGIKDEVLRQLEVLSLAKK